VDARVVEREHAAADAVASFKDNDGVTGFREFRGCGEAGGAGTDDDYVCVISWVELVDSVGHGFL
jgi:hypothetical protein